MFSDRANNLVGDRYIDEVVGDSALTDSKTEEYMRMEIDEKKRN